MPEDRYDTAAELREAIEDAMIEAMVPATTSDVAAFAAEHLSERAERRRQAIDIALAAAAERKRVEDLLRPTTDRPSYSGLTPHSSSRPVAPRLSSNPPSRDAMRTVPEAPMPKGTPLDGIAKLTARVSEPPPNAQSYATLGSAALDASEPVLPQPRSRKGVITVVTLLVIAAVGATGVSFTMFRPKPQPVVTAAIVREVASPSTPSTTSPRTSPTAKSAATAATTASPPSAPGIPTFAASALPKVTPRVTWSPPPRWTPPPSPPPAPPPPAAAPPAAAPQAAALPATAAPPAKPKPSVDDGF